MENFKIVGTKSTPEVNLNFATGEFSIRGRSLAENSVVFFADIFSLVSEYFVNPQNKTVIELKFEYFNSTSFKLIIDLLMIAKKGSTAEKTIVVKWLHEKDDEDILMLGQETERIVNLPFVYVPY